MLSQSERNELGAALTECAVMYGAEFPKERAIVYINALEKYASESLENYLSAINKYTLDKNNRFFPNPIQIRNYINQKQSPEGLATEAISRVRKAISDFGWNNAEDAKKYIGELGWDIVQRSGGWLYVCENHGVELNPLTFHAQGRELGKSILESASLGKYDQPIGIEQSEQPQKLTILRQLVSAKEIPK